MIKLIIIICTVLLLTSCISKEGSILDILSKPGDNMKKGMQICNNGMRIWYPRKVSKKKIKKDCACRGKRDCR